MISFAKTTKAAYELLTPVQDRIYYITDTGEQYLNGKPYDGEDRRDYLCLTAKQASTTVSLKKKSSSMSDVDLEYSTDKRNWTKYSWDPETGEGTSISLSAVGDKVYFRGDNTTFSTGSSAYFRFVISGKADPSGNVMSLLDKSCELLEIPDTGGRMFYQLFAGADSMTTGTIEDISGLRLPATVLASYCYGSMFVFQNNLVNGAVELPALTMKDNCYRGMFQECSSLLYPPELPATHLAQGCYSNMLQYCTSLTKAPKLPATVLATDCYKQMFRNDQSLAEIEVSFTDWNSSNGSTTNWIDMGVAASGVFKCPAALDASDTSDYSHVPSGWTVARTDAYDSQLVPSSGTAGQVLTKTASGSEWANAQGGGGGEVDYFRFTAGQANSTVKLNKVRTPPSISLEYSTDGINWTAYSWSGNSGDTITLQSIGDYVMWRGDNSGGLGSGAYDHHRFVATGKIYMSGNINTLLSKSNKTLDTIPGFCFYNLFRNAYSSSVPEWLTAPQMPRSMKLSSYCYGHMFYGCSSFEVAPELPATILSSNCYEEMFTGCSSLKKAPELPATILSSNCYYGMFTGCSSLEKAPELPATSLGIYCYYYMFNGCRNLKKAPELPATILANSCYRSMFTGCSSLEKAPELPATSLGSYCYQEMFDGCRNLSYVKMSATSSGNKYNMLNNTASGGILEAPAALDASDFLPATWTKVTAANTPDSGTSSTADASSDAVYAVLPSSESTGVVTVASSLTLVAVENSTTAIAYAEIVLDVAAGATVTAGTNLTFADAPTAGMRNVCVVRWQGGAAKLYVVSTESLPSA